MYLFLATRRHSADYSAVYALAMGVRGKEKRERRREKLEEA